MIHWHGGNVYLRDAEHAEHAEGRRLKILILEKICVRPRALRALRPVNTIISPVREDRILI